MPTGGGVGDDADGPGNEGGTGVSGGGEEGEEGGACEGKAGGGEGDGARPEHADEEAGGGAGSAGSATSSQPSVSNRGSVVLIARSPLLR